MSKSLVTLASTASVLWWALKTRLKRLRLFLSSVIRSEATEPSAPESTSAGFRRWVAPVQTHGAWELAILHWDTALSELRGSSLWQEVRAGATFHYFWPALSSFPGKKCEIYLSPQLSHSLEILQLGNILWCRDSDSRKEENTKAKGRKEMYTPVQWQMDREEQKPLKATIMWTQIHVPVSYLSLFSTNKNLVLWKPVGF